MNLDEETKQRVKAEHTSTFKLLEKFKQLEQQEN